MDYEPFAVEYVPASLRRRHVAMYPPRGEKNMGNFIVWDANAGKIVAVQTGEVSGMERRADDRRVDWPAMERWKAI